MEVDVYGSARWARGTKKIGATVWRRAGVTTPQLGGFKGKRPNKAPFGSANAGVEFKLPTPSHATPMVASH
jgi:hypothetical protein